MNVDRTETRIVRYYVHSKGGDCLLCVDDHTSALEYAREGVGRKLSVVIQTTTRQALTIEAPDPGVARETRQGNPAPDDPSLTDIQEMK